MRGVIVVPRRTGTPHRDRAWEYTRPWWEKLGYEMYEVEQDDARPFNRAWCINEGARRAWPWDVLMIIDADVIENEERQVHEAFDRAYETGRFTVGHVAGHDLNQIATKTVYSRQTFNWNHRSSLAEVRAVCDSRCNAMRADLFETLGGYDTRFEGWGHEDVAFTFAVQALQPGDYERIPGNSWHFYHPPMLKHSRQTQDWKNGEQLMRRYEAASKRGFDAVKEILDEREPDQMWTPGPDKSVEYDLVMLSNGRREYLLETYKSFREHASTAPANCTIVNDSGDPAFRDWLEKSDTFKDFMKVHHAKNRGFGMATTSAWEQAAKAKSPYVFYLEEDFVFDRPFIIRDMAQVLQDRSDLAQVALLRAPFFKAELKAGSIPNEHPKHYTRQTTRGIRFLKHKLFYTTNPSLMKRETFASGWPGTKPHSERAKTGEFVVDGKEFAFMGWGESWCHHIGEQRTGRGY